jgi:eukaryotic-like serine/threonine-protein kinase
MVGRIRLTAAVASPSEKMNQTQSERSVIAHYRIISRVGTGGMGEVYLAEDTRLGRNVALKVLLDTHALDSDTRRRFGQEARSASGLNHPNIITIHEIGEWENNDYIAMEFVQGESVRDLILGKHLKLGDAINIAMQVASALSAAHAAHIVHRDIKPENLIRRPDGLVKVLDFGLAKQAAAVAEPIEVDSEASTYGPMGTLPGMVMGTVPYMSPEQARGKPVDARTDIWSLGVVLYEMIAGRTPFNGETKSDLMAAILTRDPDPLFIDSPEASREIEHIVRKALVKDRDERYQSIKDFQLDLKILQGDLNSGAFHTELLSRTTAEEAAAKTERHLTGASDAFPARRTWPAIAAVLVLAAIAGYLLWNRGRTASTSYLTSLTSSQVTSWKSDLSEGDTGAPKFSPDGKLIAYVAPKNGRNAVWVKQIAGGEPFTRKQDDSTETSPIWSPDGERIAYFSNRGGRRGIWAAPALGGPPTLLANLDTRGRLVKWSKNGSTIFFDTDRNLYSIDVASGQSTKLTNFDDSQLLQRNFAVSPDEQRIVYTDRRDGQSDLWMAGISGGNPVRLTNDSFTDGEPVWHPDGKRIIYSSERNGTKQLYLALADGGEPIQLTLSDSDIAVADVSPDGKEILYTTSKDDSDLWAINLENQKETQLTSDIGAEFWPDLSPDGSVIAYQAARRTSVGSRLLNCQLFSQPLAGDPRPTSIAPDGYSPRWSPDGKQIAFLRSEAGNSSLWVTSAAGGDARRVTEGGVLFGGFSMLPFTRVQSRDYDWSPDGSSLVYSANRDGVSNIWRAEVNGGETQLTGNTEKGSIFFDPASSPDGSAVAWLVLKLGKPDEQRWAIWLLKDQKTNEVYQSEEPLRLVGWNAAGNDLAVQSVDRGKDTVRTPVNVTLFEIGLNFGSTPRKIADLRETYLHSTALSRDRRTLAYVSRTESGDALNVLPLGGGATRSIASGNDPRVYFSSLAFAPDGKTLYYGKQANWQVISSINNFQ